MQRKKAIIVALARAFRAEWHGSRYRLLCLFCWQFKEVIFSSYEPGYAMMKGTIFSAIPGCSEGQVRRDSRGSLAGVHPDPLLWDHRSEKVNE
jgi:hypothetical protein